MDVCPECHGAWLYREALAQLIAAAGPSSVDNGEHTRQEPADVLPHNNREDDRRTHHHDRDDRDDETDTGAAQPSRRSRKGGFLSNLMDVVGGGEPD